MASVGHQSSSKITTYKGCPMAYFLQYILHEKVSQNIRLAFGGVMHQMLKEFYEKNFKNEDSFANSWSFRWLRYCSGDHLRESERKGLIVTEYPMKNGSPLRIGNHISFGRHTEKEDIPGMFFGYLKKGKEILGQFYHEYKPRPRPVIKEERFKLEIPGHPDEHGLRRKHKVVVVFDRVDVFKDTNGEWRATIADYKTDSGDPSGKGFYIHRHPQFTLYSLAFRQLIAEGRLKGRIPDEIKEESAILYFHMREGKIVPTYRNETDFNYVRSLMDDVADGILCDRFTPFYGFHCNMCDYQVPCEKYSVSHGGPRIIDLEDRIKEASVFDWEEDFQSFLRGEKKENKENPTYMLPQLGQLELKFTGEEIPTSFKNQQPPKSEQQQLKHKQGRLFKKQRATGLLVPAIKFKK